MALKEVYNKIKMLEYILHGSQGKSICHICFSEDDNLYYKGSDKIFIKSESFEGYLTVSCLAESVLNKKGLFYSTLQSNCSSCVRKMIEFYSFQKQCQRSDEISANIMESLMENFNNVREELDAFDKCKMFIVLGNEKSHNIGKYGGNKCAKSEENIARSENNKIPRHIYYKAIENISSNKVGDKDYFTCKMCKCKYDKTRNFRNHCLKKCYKTCPIDKKIVEEIKRLMVKKHFYQCNGCCKSFSKFTEYSYHECPNKSLKKPTAMTNYKCQNCGFISSKCFEFRRHLKNVCYKNDLKAMEAAYETYTQVCELCGKRLTSTFGYINHAKTCRAKNIGVFSEKYVCDICDAVFYVRKILISHFKQCHSDEVFPCHVCGKQFNSKRKVDKHQIVHTKERNFECDICHKLFVTRPARLFHRRIHTGETPYSCSLCNLKYVSKSRLMAHVRRKHQQSEFQCNLCPKTFGIQCELRRHEKRHLNPNSRLFIPAVCE